MKRIFLALIFISAFTASRADYILVPMDQTQANHLKAYGIAFQSLKAENTVQWLLNYRGGAFLLAQNDANESLLKAAGVSYDQLSDNATQGIISNILTGNNGMNLVTMNHLPKIAVYAPSFDRHYDDAVMLALSYAGIDYTTIYDKEVLTTDMGQYDWIHLDHEDFTGQYNKWLYMYGYTPWYKAMVADNEAMAAQLGYKKVSQMKLAVAKKLRTFVENGGQLFAMCAGTEKMDIALAADGLDIVGAADGDPADRTGNSKLDFNNTFAFQDFTVDLDPASANHSNIGVYAKSKTTTDRFTLAAIDAKQDLTGAMLVQDHETSIKEFVGNTTAFKKDFIKPSAQIIGSTVTDVKYLHGQRGRGYFTFYAGHDPEAFMHLVGDPATNLDNYKQSAGYRLILNNVLSPAVTDNTLGVANVALVDVKTYPNPFVGSFTVEINNEDAKQAKITVCNLNGQVMLTDNIASDNGLFMKQYNTTGFAAGLYIIEISNAKGSIAKKLLTKAEL